MEKIVIEKSPTADSRTADHIVTKGELYDSSVMHIKDVMAGMRLLASMIKRRGRIHDWTKLEYIDEFYQQFREAQRTGKWPEEGSWWYNNIHCSMERHHLKDMCPEDVNLIDVLEQIVDNVMAGLARSGRYRRETPDPDMLVKAYENTVKLLLEHVEIIEQ